METQRRRPKLRQPYICCVSVVVCLLVLFSNSDVVVLCIGEDGHIAIETASGNCYGHLPAGVCDRGAIALVQDNRSTDDDCGSCVDIPLSGGFVGTLSTAKKENPFPVTATAVGPLFFEPLQSSGLELALKSFTPTSYFTPLRSVILLI